MSTYFPCASLVQNTVAVSFTWYGEKKQQVSAKEQVGSHEDKSQSQSDEKILIATWHEGSTSTTTTNHNNHMEGDMQNQRLIGFTHFIAPDSGLEAQLVFPRMGKAIPTKSGRMERKGQIRDRNHRLSTYLSNTLALNIPK